MRILGIITIMVFSLSSFSQEKTIDKRIVEVFGEERANSMFSNKASQLYNIMLFKLDNSYQVVDIGEKVKTKEIKLLSNVSVREKKGVVNKGGTPLEEYKEGRLNVLQYYFRTEKNTKTFYLIDGTTKCLMFYSDNELIENFKKQNNE